jgi:hypothetical protein
VPLPADQSASVATRRCPRSRRRAWNGQPISQIRVAAAQAAAIGIGSVWPIGIATSCTWISVSNSALR